MEVGNQFYIYVSSHTDLAFLEEAKKQSEVVVQVDLRGRQLHQAAFSRSTFKIRSTLADTATDDLTGGAGEN